MRKELLKILGCAPCAEETIKRSKISPQAPVQIYHTMTADVGKVFIQSTGRKSVAGLMIGRISLSGRTVQLWLQGGQINISTNAAPAALVVADLNGVGEWYSHAIISNVIATVNGQSSAIGAGYTSTLFANQYLAILFFSGQAELSNPAFILKQGLCRDSLVDQSSINVNTDNLGCYGGAPVLHSINPHDWRKAMARLQPITLPIETPKLSLLQ